MYGDGLLEEDRCVSAVTDDETWIYTFDPETKEESVLRLEMALPYKRPNIRTRFCRYACTDCCLSTYMRNSDMNPETP